MRKILPLAILGIVALAGCASAGGPEESSAPAPETPQPTVTETVTPEPTPEPTATADPPEVPEEPYPLDEDALSGYSLDDVSGGEPLVVWADDTYTLVHVIGTGSGTPACQPYPEEAEIDDGRLEALDFSWDHADEMQACTADMRVFGSAFPVVGADESITEASISDWTQSDDDDDLVVEIRPPMGTN